MAGSIARHDAVEAEIARLCAPRQGHSDTGRILHDEQQSGHRAEDEQRFTPRAQRAELGRQSDRREKDEKKKIPCALRKGDVKPYGQLGREDQDRDQRCPLTSRTARSPVR